MELTKHWKEALTRIALGNEMNISSLSLPEEAMLVLKKIESFRKDLDKEDVLNPIRSVFPDFVHSEPQYPLNNKELFSVLKQESYKHRCLVAHNKLNTVILNDFENTEYSWEVLVKEIAEYLSNYSIQDDEYTMLNNLSWEEDEVVCSYGYNCIDSLIEGGITKGSYTVFYGKTSMGKSTVVTRHLACDAIKKGKRPLIISLEGNVTKTQKRILLQLAGMAKKDPSRLSDDERKKIDTLSKTVAAIPIIDKNAYKRWQLDRLARIYKPDIIIYDQLTVGSKSRDWQDMATLSNMLKKFSLESNIPVVAITQSNAKYNDGEAENKNEDIKYSEAIRQDALTVIKISDAYPKHDHKRILTIEKCKDDETASKLPIKILVEWTDNGMEERSVHIGSKTISAPDFLIGYNENREVRRIEKNDTNTRHIQVDTNSDIIDDGVSNDNSINEIVNTGNVLRTEMGDFNLPDLWIKEDFDTGRYENTGARMRLVGKLLKIDELVSVGSTWDTHHKAKYDDYLITEDYYHGNTHEVIQPYFFSQTLKGKKNE